MPTSVITPKPTPVGFTFTTRQAAASHSESALVADFGSIPPEVNSARMYAGAGPDPLLKAAAMWEALSADLYAHAGSHRDVTTQLTAEAWLGPASAMMSAATTPYLNWLHDTAALAARTAKHARAAVAAYEAARAMTVPPIAVAANRAALAALSGGNTLGLDAHTIAAVEAQYREMWAQDASAMYVYADTSADASTIIPFLPPPGAVGDVAHVGMSSAIVQTLKRLASPMRTDAPALASLPGALEGLRPVSWTAARSVARVTVRAGSGTAKAVGELSVPPRWSAMASVGTPASGFGTWTPTIGAATVPMMPTTRHPRSGEGPYRPVGRPGPRSVIRMRSLV